MSDNEDDFTRPPTSGPDVMSDMEEDSQLEKVRHLPNREDESVTPSTVSREDLHRVEKVAAQTMNSKKKRAGEIAHRRGLAPAPAAGENDSGYFAGDDDTVSTAATNLSDASQASIDSIASSVAESVAESVASGLPLPDAEHMLIEAVDGVHRLLPAGMNWFNMVAERAGGYGPIASIAFISLLSANPDLLPTLSLPTMDLTHIASQIGLTANAANAANAAAAPATTGIFSSLTGAATSAAASISNGIMAGITAIVAMVGTNKIVANPLTIDHIASMVESAGHNAIEAAITARELKHRLVTSLKKLKANWTVKNLRVEGISALHNENIETLVSNAVAEHGRSLAPAEGEPRMKVDELTDVYSRIIDDINNVAPTEHVPAIAEKKIRDNAVNEAANDLIQNAAADAVAGAKPTRGGKKNRKSQKKPRKKVTMSNRGKKAARKTKKQSRRKSRGKKH